MCARYVKGVCLVTPNTKQGGGGGKGQPELHFLHPKHKVSQTFTGFKFSLINKRKFEFHYETFKVYKDLFGKPFKHDCVARVVFPT